MEARLRRFDEPVLLEMEAYAEQRGFPIVGRNVGVTLEVLARSVEAERIIELGSGFGYSAYWHARAVGAGGEVHLTDGDPENEIKAADTSSAPGSPTASSSMSVTRSPSWQARRTSST